MRFLVFGCLFFVSSVALAQTRTEDSVEIEVKVGDSITLDSCSGDHYLHVDYFRKTRWVGTPKPYDTSTGEGFYKSFFTSGDFDIKDLPCSYKGTTLAVMGVEVLSNKNTGQPMYVLYLRGRDPNSILWVDFYEAVEAGELRFVRYQ